MKKILEQKASYLYEANDGRKFRNEEDCIRYEYLCDKWLSERFQSINTDDTEIYCYPINSYEDILEIKDFERLHEWNYPSVHPQESYYQIPGWVYVPYSPSGLDYPEVIEPISHLEDCVNDTDDTLTRIRNDIAEMRGKH